MDPPTLSLPDSKDSDSHSTVSVLLPTYNPESKYIGQAIQSVGNQTYESVELVIIDSTGLDWLRGLASRHPWISYHFQEPSGLPAAWNAGIEAATGEFVGFLSDDDYYVDEKISRQVRRLEQGYDIVYADEYVLDQDGSLTYLSSLPIKDPDTHHIDYFRKGHGVPHLTVMGRMACFQTEMFDERLEVREDPHLWVRLFERFEVARIDDALAYKRRREDSATGDPEMLYENELREIELLCEEFPELAEFREERENLARYRYGKHLFRLGHTPRARSVFADLLRNGMVDFRVFGLFLASVLPLDSKAMFKRLETVAERRKR